MEKKNKFEKFLELLESIDERYKKNILIATTIFFVFLFIFILYFSYQNNSAKVVNIDDLPVIVDVNKNKVKKIKHTLEDVNLDDLVISQTLESSDKDKKTKIMRGEGVNYNLNMKINEIMTGYETEEVKNDKDVVLSKNIKNVNMNSSRGVNNGGDFQEQQEYKHYYKAQLVAFVNEHQADIFLNQTKTKYSNLLKNVKIFISTADLGTKGIFYRVQVGFFRTKLEADNFCDAYLRNSNKNELNCIVVR